MNRVTDGQRSSPSHQDRHAGPRSDRSASSETLSSEVLSGSPSSPSSPGLSGSPGESGRPRDLSEGSRRPSSDSFEWTVARNVAGERLDKVLSLMLSVSRKDAARLIDDGLVTIEGKVAISRSRPVSEGDRLSVAIPPAQTSRLRPDPDVEFKIVFADEDLIVVDKPAGLVVHHGSGHASGTLVDGLIHRFPDLRSLEKGGGVPERPGIVHRLDKGTSGLMVVARTARAQRSLSLQLRERSAGRTYLALVKGSLDADAGVIDAPIGRSSRTPTRMAVSRGGRDARTSYSVLQRFARPVQATLVEAKLETGRTHQIRVHLAAIGHPVIGDDRYGGRSTRPPELGSSLGPGRVFLHAHRLALKHPDGRDLSWDSPLPPDLVDTLSRLNTE